MTNALPPIETIRTLVNYEPSNHLYTNTKHYIQTMRLFPLHSMVTIFGESSTPKKNQFNTISYLKEEPVDVNAWIEANKVHG